MTRKTARESTLARMAREREEDRTAGRPQRGLFTGRGRGARASADDAPDDEDEMRDDQDIDDADEMDDLDVQPRTGAKRTILGAIRQVPSYIRLLVGLMGDGRVSRLDRLFVVAAAAYIVSPLDFIPDFIPFLGETDDVFLLVLAVQRLVDNAGRRVLMDHWRGDPGELSDVNLSSILSAAGFFLPKGIKRRLTRFARPGRRS